MRVLSRVTTVTQPSCSQSTSTSLLVHVWHMEKWKLCDTRLNIQWNGSSTFSVRIHTLYKKIEREMRSQQQSLCLLFCIPVPPHPHPPPLSLILNCLTQVCQLLALLLPPGEFWNINIPCGAEECSVACRSTRGGQALLQSLWNGSSWHTKRLLAVTYPQRWESDRGKEQQRQVYPGMLGKLMRRERCGKLQY